jgi:hypothetical protein
VVFFAVFLLATASGKTKDNQRPSCSILYRVVQEDTLGNFQEGLANTKNLKWADNGLRKKYPDVCYTPTDQESSKLQPRFEIVDSQPPAPVEVFLFISISPATYHGTRVATQTHTEDAPTSGTVTGTSGEEIGTYTGTTRTTSASSTAVPYSFEYGKFILIIETTGADGKPVPRHIFEQDGLYRTMYGVPLGGRGHHPVKALIEDAVKWLHAGGLDDTSQSVSGVTH